MQGFVLVPNLSWDFARRGRVIPYAIGGYGILRGFFTARTWAASAGLGARVYVNERLFASPEVRFG